MSMAAQRIQRWANSKCGRKSFRKWTTSPLKNENKNRKKQMNTNRGKHMNMITDIFRSGTFQTEAKARSDILDSMLAALSDGKITEFVERFGDDFKFTDHALNLEFIDKWRLSEFLTKSRELFPDTLVKVRATYETEDYAIAEWTVTATETVTYGSMQARFPISFSGVSVAQICD